MFDVEDVQNFVDSDWLTVDEWEEQTVQQCLRLTAQTLARLPGKPVTAALACARWGEQSA